MRYSPKYEIINTCKIIFFIAFFIILTCQNIIFADTLANIYDVHSIEKGALLFKKHCSLCHGMKADGAGSVAKSLSLKPRNFNEEKLKYGNTPRDIYNTITEGRSDVMPAFNETLNKKEIEYLAIYIWNILPENHRSEEKKSNKNLENKK